MLRREFLRLASATGLAWPLGAGAQNPNAPAVKREAKEDWGR